MHRVRGRVADVRLRLPTYFCAPNFACLMVADAYDAVSGVPGVRAGRDRARRTTSPPTEINRGVAARAGFVAVLRRPGRDGELDELRADFVAQGDARPPPTGCAGRCSRRTRRRDELAVLTLGDVPPSPDRERLRGAPGRAGPAGGRRRAAAGGPGHAARRSACRRCPCTYGAPG